MATKISSGGPRVECEKTADGNLNTGFYIGGERPPKCDSMKYVFDLDGKGHFNACWGTGSLDSQMAKVKPGDFLRVECMGKGEPFETTGKDGNQVTVRAWQFDVAKADNQEEVDAWQKEYRAHVMGGGK